MARIAFLLPDFRGGGAERVALTVIEGLVDRGHDIDLLLCHAEGILLRHLPRQVRVVDLATPRMRHAFRALVRYLKSVQPDALQASMWPLTVIAAAAARFTGSRTRVVTSDHSALSRAYKERGRLHHAILRQSIRTFYPVASARIAVSEGVRVDLASMGLAKGSIEVVHNPIHRPSTGSGAEFAWPGTGRRILTVGNLVPAKDQAVLIRAMAIVTREVDCSLVICGEGELRSDLSKLVISLGLESRVFLVGFIGDIAPVYALSELFVLSSAWEGSPLAIVEAMQAGLPVVATDCDFGPRELLDDGRYGLLVMVGDVDGLARAIVKALGSTANPEIQRARAHELSAEPSIDRYEALLLGADAKR